MAFPTSLSNFAKGDTILSSWANALETKIGIDSSAVITSLDYLLKSTSSSNPGHKHTLANGATDITASTTNLNSINQTLGTSNSPTFAGLTLTAFSGYVKATAGVLSAGSIADGDLPSALTGKTYNALTLVAASVGFTIAGGTTSKTLTVDETASLTGYAKKTDNLSVFAATTSLQLLGVISDETGSGALVFANTPTLVTPVIGAATATTINGLTITANGTNTLNITAGKTLTIQDNVTITGALGTGAYATIANYATLATPVFTTNITTPLIIGGTGVAQTLILRSTSGVGEAGADIIFQTGNNGATEVGRIFNSGIVNLPLQSGARGYKLTTNQTGIPNNTWTKIELNGESYDTQGEFDSTTKVGTASATSANHLVDATLSPFVAGDVGRMVRNTTDNTYATITVVNSTSDVTISADIMVNGEGYRAYFSRFTATKAGYYLIAAQIDWASTADQTLLRASIYKNGAFYASGYEVASGTGRHRSRYVDVIYLAAADYIELWGLQASGGAITAYEGEGGTSMAIQKLS